jgi:integrase/recombinase XerD
MLTTDVERYLSLRQSLGFKLSTPSRHLRAFARFAAQHGETHIRNVVAVDWAMGAPTPGARRTRLPLRANDSETATPREFTLEDA